MLKYNHHNHKLTKGGIPMELVQKIIDIIFNKGVGNVALMLSGQEYSKVDLLIGLVIISATLFVTTKIGQYMRG